MVGKYSRISFPWLEKELGSLTEKLQQLVSILEVIRIEDFIPNSYGYRGRPLKNRKAIARACVAKAIYNMPTTRILLDRLDRRNFQKDLWLGEQK